jgi:AraC family transcriptional regulator, activator of mtrCDE
VRPEIQEICRFAARWEAEHQAEPLGWAQFHIVTKGRCFLEQRYGEPLLLQAGHLLWLPHGDAHVVRSAGREGRIRTFSSYRRANARIAAKRLGGVWHKR